MGSGDQLRRCAHDARRIEQARAAKAFVDVDDMCERAMLDPRACERLADAGTLRGLAGYLPRSQGLALS
ncbi:MAG: hypothetical protein J0I96_11055 [Rhodanobacter sp.]|nr:hypothetical protein [Rhodanobacter sp.]